MKRIKKGLSLYLRDSPMLDKTYLRNFDTKGEVSPLRIKWPEGPSLPETRKTTIRALFPH